MNPFEPPSELTTPACDSADGLADSFRISVTLTPEYVMEAFARYRSQRSRRRLWLGFRIFGALIFLIGVVVGILVPNYLVATASLGLGVFVLFPHAIENWLALRNFRRSPQCSTEMVMTVSSDGVHAISPVEDTQLDWNAFTSAAVFDDGLLLLREPRQIYWVPFDLLERPERSQALCDLICSKVPTNR